jgi:hypothetical protein
LSVKRWEDDAVVWKGPQYFDRRLEYDPAVKSGYVSGRIITCVDVVDWSGTGTRDILISSWDACYDGQVYLRRQIGTNPDKTPTLGAEEVVQGVRGYVTAFRDGDIFHLVSASRMRHSIYLYVNTGQPGAPEFGDPIELKLNADWVKANEYYHLARVIDIDGDGKPELIVGTDFWDDYWPNGLEWNDKGYKGYDAADRWLGGPLRGFLYSFKIDGSVSRPKLQKGRPILAGETPFEAYGQLAPAFGDFTGTGRQDLVSGEFWNILHFARSSGSGDYDDSTLVSGANGQPIELDHCIHIPCVVDWDGDGHLDLLVGAEDGYVTFIKNMGRKACRTPIFETIGRVETTSPIVHASVLPTPTLFQSQGKDLPDLIVGNCSGELLFFETSGPRNAPTLLREVRLRAGGQEVLVNAGLTGSIQGPSEKMFGYTCPTVADWTGNRHSDVLMSDVLGRHVLFENCAGSYPPEFECQQLLTFNSVPLKTVWRVRPAVVDWLADGQLHYLCLDDLGRLSDFKKLSKTELHEKRHFTWEDGTVVTFTEDVGGGRGRVKLCVCDWNERGRFDLIVGTHARASLPPGPKGEPRHSTGQAGIFYLENIGSNALPVFAKPQAFQFKGEIIQMGMHVASPEAVDWTGTGELGLLVGVEDGSLVWLDRRHLSYAGDL